MSTTTTNARRVVAVIDVDEPAKLVHHDVEAREPDMYDEGMAWWFGDHAIVAVDVLQALDMASILDEPARTNWVWADALNRGGVHAKGGLMPESQGVFVYTHARTIDVTNVPIQHKVEYALWRLAQDIVLVQS